MKEVESLPVDDMWGRYHEHLGIDPDDYTAYFRGARTAVGLHVGEVHALVPVPLREIQRLVPGFVPPQGILWLRDELGKYEALLPRLSNPLPSDAFPQRSLGFDISPQRRRTG